MTTHKRRFRDQRLHDRRLDQPAACGGNVGRIWRTIAQADRLATAESVAQRARTDGGLVCVQHVAG